MKILGVHTDGVFAEYVKIPEICAWKLPKDTLFEIGAIYEPFTIAINCLLKDKIGGYFTVISGCGPIVLFTIGIASICGANPIFAIDINDYRLDIAKKMADNVLTLNPLKDDVIKIVKGKTDGYGADVVIELSVSVEAIQIGFKSLHKG